MYYESVKVLLERRLHLNMSSEEILNDALDFLNLVDQNSDKIKTSNDALIAASIYFIVLNNHSIHKNFKQCAELFDIDAKALTLKVKEIVFTLELNNADSLIMKGLMVTESEKIEAEKVSVKTHHTRSTNKSHSPLKTTITDKELIELFKSFIKYFSVLFKDKEFIEIKTFLKLFDNTLVFAGYDIKSIDTEKKFGDLFIYLMFEPKKGREPDKFVNLRDRFGKYEPYSLIKLGE